MSADPATAPALDPHDYTWSVVIPVYNSAPLVGQTVDGVLAVLAEHGLRHQVVLVNDGSTDGSWEVISEKARTHDDVIAVDLLKNYGQHHANLAGLRETTGDFVITMDDDGQNPPDQVPLLIDAAMQRPRRGVRRLRAQAGRRLPPAGQPPDRAGEPPRLRPAGRPGGLQLPGPAPRRRRPDLLLPHRAPLPHRPGAALLRQPGQRLGAPRAARGRRQHLLVPADPRAWSSRSCSATPPGRCAPWR